MLSIRVDRGIGKIVIQTDDPSVKCLLEFKRKESVYAPWLKQWRQTEIIDKIYDNKRVVPKGGIFTFTLGLGWSAYVANVFRTSINQDEYMDVLGSIFSESYREFPFPNLRDYQNEDVLHLLKYKIGLCTVNTGYGKTELIATLANYAYRDLGKKVLIVAPGKKAKDELVKRCNTKFGLDIPNSVEGDIGCIITSGLLNQKKLKDPVGVQEFENHLKKFDWVLVDEVEYTINPSGEFLFSRLTKADHFYGFSGSADKYGGKMISFARGIDETVAQNKDLVKYFGPSLVYRMPMNLDIDNIQVKTEALNNLSFSEEDFADDSNVYMTVMSEIWTDPGICNTIVKIAKRFPMLFIPINNLNYIISEWIEKYFLGVFRILLISGEGYIYHDLSGNRTSLSLSEACDYIRNGLVDIIPSTSSGYRALDFPGLENIFLIQGVIAGVVLQCIGRVARSKHMNIISIAPKKYARIPVYTKGMKERDAMIKEYYKYCDLKDSVINEENL